VAILKRAYGVLHAVLIRTLRALPVSSKLFGPPKGIVADMKVWVAKFRARHPASSDSCWYKSVHESTGASLPPPRSLAPAPRIFADEQRARFPEAFTACVPDARVVMRTGVVISPDDRVFEQSCCWGREWFLPSDIEYNSVRPLLSPRKLPGGYMTILSRMSPNYYHWFSECLTRLCVADELGDLPILLPGNLTAWQRESLALLGVGGERVLQLDEGCYEVERLYFPSFPGTVGFMADWAFRDLRRRFCGDRPRAGGKRLYVGRGGTAHRHVKNEELVMRALEKQGFVSVEAHGLTVAEQVELFANADVIVGVHGAAMTNVLFAPAGTPVIEILDPMHVVGCYYALSASLRQRYWYLFGENSAAGEGRASRKGYDDISIPLELLLRTLDAALLKDPPAPPPADGESFDSDRHSREPRLRSFG
jgi:hypothetical protein